MDFKIILIMKNFEFITSYKFAEMSNVVYSGVFTDHQLEELKISRYTLVEKNNEFKYIRIKKFKLKENDIIFSRTEDVRSLFYILKTIKFKNIKLITHQSDINVTKKLTRKIPECISRWYSVNLSTENPKLEPIPIGLANNHIKNLNQDDFDSFNLSNLNFFSQKQPNKLIYLNFQKSTNFKEREGIYELFNSKEWAIVSLPTNDKQKYLDNLKNTNFVLTPSGNGLDTHRFWETIYSGSIPVVKENIGYEYAVDLPVLFVKDYRLVTKDLLIDFLEKNNHKNFNLKKLDFNYWKLKINNEKVENSSLIDIETRKLAVFLINYLYKFNHKIKSYKKVFVYYLKKLKKIFNPKI